MTHNPILKTIQVSLFESPNIGRNQVGILYSNNEYRSINPGEKISFNKRLFGGGIFYLVDMAPHQISWQVNLITNDDRTTFPVMINLNYQVIDAEKMVKDEINDTESMIARIFEPRLRKKTREYPLNHYRDAEIELENILSPIDFEKLGLKRLEVDVVMNLSDTEFARIEELNNLERAKKIPQQTEHDVELPTKDPAYKFLTLVIFNYKVIDENRLPTATLEEAEDWLWRRVRATLRRVARDFEVNQVQEADEAMRKAIEHEAFSDHGLGIVSKEIEIDLDERARIRAEKLDEIRVESELDEERRQHRLAAQKFYNAVMEGNRLGLLVDLLASEKMDAREVLDYLDDKQREDMVIRFEAFKILLDKDGLPEDERDERTIALIRSIENQLLKGQESFVAKLPGIEKPPLAASVSKDQSGDGDVGEVISEQNGSDGITSSEDSGESMSEDKIIEDDVREEKSKQNRSESTPRMDGNEESDSKDQGKEGEDVTKKSDLHGFNSTPHNEGESSPKE